MVCLVLLFNVTTSSFAMYSSDSTDLGILNNNQYRTVIVRESKELLLSKTITRQDIDDMRAAQSLTYFLFTVYGTPLFSFSVFIADSIYSNLTYPQHACDYVSYVTVEKHYKEHKLTGKRHLDAVYRNYEATATYSDGGTQNFNRRLRDK